MNRSIEFLPEEKADLPIWISLTVLFVRRCLKE